MNSLAVAMERGKVISGSQHVTPTELSWFFLLFYKDATPDGVDSVQGCPAA